MIRLLLIDECRLLVTLLSHALLQATGDLIVDTACGCEEAAQVVAAVRPTLTMVNLSGRNSSGLMMAGRLIERDAHIPVMAYCFEENDHLVAERAFSIGVAGYVSHKDSFEDIVDAIRVVAAGNKYVSKSVESRLASRWRSNMASLRGDPLSTLSDREYEVLRFTGHGYVMKEISSKLSVSVKTIETYKERIKAKLGCNDSQDLLRYAMYLVRGQTPEPTQIPKPSKNL